jgi:hypothetical protein
MICAILSLIFYRKERKEKAVILREALSPTPLPQAGEG